MSKMLCRNWMQIFYLGWNRIHVSLPPVKDNFSPWTIPLMVEDSIGRYDQYNVKCLRISYYVRLSKREIRSDGLTTGKFFRNLSAGLMSASTWSDSTTSSAGLWWSLIWDCITSRSSSNFWDALQEEWGREASMGVMEYSTFKQLVPFEASFLFRKFIQMKWNRNYSVCRMWCILMMEKIVLMLEYYKSM